MLSDQMQMMRDHALPDTGIKQIRVLIGSINHAPAVRSGKIISLNTCIYCFCLVKLQFRFPSLLSKSPSPHKFIVIEN